LNASIVICTRNRVASLDQTLHSLRTVSIPAGFNCEILVVDNGSTDGTRELVQKRMAAQPLLRYCLEPAAGLSRARNAGLSQSVGDIILFTDDDIQFPADWLKVMCEPIIAGQADAVAGNVEMAPHLQRAWMTPLHRTWLACTDPPDPLNPTDLIGASTAFARSVLDVVPSFDVELGAGALGFDEEMLFGAQLRQSGRKICASKGDPVIHHFQQDRLLRRSWLAAAEKKGKSRAYVDYHWRHETSTRPHVRFCTTLAKYGFWRALKLRECAAEEGIPAWELNFVETLNRLREYVKLRNCPRKYDRHGLIKHNV